MPRRSHHAKKHRLIRYAGDPFVSPGEFDDGKPILMAADFKNGNGKGDSALEAYSFGRK